MLLIVAFVACDGLSTIAAAAEETLAWTSYHNTRFGVTADVPQGWRAGPPPANNDGLVFTSPDGMASLTISGMLNLEPDVAVALDSLGGEREDEQITYKQRSGNTLTLSGFKTADKIFYAKYLLSCHNQILNSIYFEYPAAQKVMFDSIVTHIAHSLKPGPGDQITNCGS
jgi:hypothetical protein